MLRRNIAILLINRKFILVVFLLFFFNGVFIYKSAIDEYNNVNVYEEFMEWLGTTEDPLEACDTYLAELYVNYDQLRFTNSLYEEHIFISEVREYVRDIKEYKHTIENLIQNIKNRANFSFLEQSDGTDSASHTIEAYQALSDVRPVMGNYFALEKFMSIGVTDGILLLIIIAACTFVLIEERERGMYLLIKTSKRGRLSYYLWKTGALMGVTLMSGILLYIQSFMIYVGLYGCDSLHVPIQSVSGFLLSPYKISIAGTLLIFSVLKAGAFAIITVFIILICLLPIKATAVYLMNSLMIISNVWMYLGISRSSKYVILKYMNYFSLVDIKNYISSLNYFPIAGREIPLLYFSLVIMAVSFVITLLLGIAAYLSHKKAKVFQSFQNKRIRWFGFCVLPNEFTRLMIFRGGVVLLAAYLLSAIYMQDFNEIKNDTNRYFKDYVKLLNNMEQGEAGFWIEDRLQELNALEMEAERLGILFNNGKISKAAYEQSLRIIQEQLSIRPLIIKLQNQSRYIAGVYKERGIICDYVYEPLYDDTFGERGRSDRYMNGIVIALFSVCFIIPVFAYDNQYKVDRLLLVTKTGTSKLADSRISIVLVLGTAMIVFMKVVWLISLDARYGIVGLSSPIQSLPLFEAFPFTITIGSILILQLIVEVILMLFVCLLLISLSMIGKEVVQSLLYAILCCVCPVVLGLLNFKPAIRYWITPFFVSNTLLTDGNAGIYINMVLMIIGIFVIYVKSGRKWRAV